MDCHSLAMSAKSRSSLANVPEGKQRYIFSLGDCRYDSWEFLAELYLLAILSNAEIGDFYVPFVIESGFSAILLVGGVILVHRGGRTATNLWS